MSTEELDGAEQSVAGSEAVSNGHDNDAADEREARDMGWVPPEEWKGDPPRGGFKTAAEFVQRGHEILPVVNSRLRKTEEEKRKLADEFESYKRESTDKLTRMERMTRVALERQKSQIISDFEARKEAAVEVGDKAAYREIDKEQRTAVAEFDEKIAEKPEEKTATVEPPREIMDWIAQNPWFEADEEMKHWATGYHGKLLKEKKGMALSENLAEVSKQARKRFPEMFGTPDDDEPEARRGSRVEGGSRMAGDGGGRSAWSKLPADAKAQADTFIKEDGLFLLRGETAEKDLNKARERYAAKYLEG